MSTWRIPPSLWPDTLFDDGETCFLFVDTPARFPRPFLMVSWLRSLKTTVVSRFLPVRDITSPPEETNVCIAGPASGLALGLGHIHEHIFERTSFSFHVFTRFVLSSRHRAFLVEIPRDCLYRWKESLIINRNRSPPFFGLIFLMKFSKKYPVYECREGVSVWEYSPLLEIAVAPFLLLPSINYYYKLSEYKLLFDEWEWGNILAEFTNSRSSTSSSGSTFIHLYSPHLILRCSWQKILWKLSDY